MKPLLILKTYAWLIKTLREYGPITFKELNAMWNDDRLSEGNSMVRQTYARYKRDIEEFFNITIRCDSQNRYYIENERSLNQDSVPNWMMIRRRSWPRAKESVRSWFSPSISRCRWRSRR